MKTVLIVDDSRTSRKMLRTIIESVGLEVIGEAADGEEGYLKYKELRPDLVTMDITMPKMDGVECLQLIKRENEKAKVIMVTAAGQKDKVFYSAKYGAIDFITKPYDRANLEKILRKVSV